MTNWLHLKVNSLCPLNLLKVKKQAPNTLSIVNVNYCAGVAYPKSNASGMFQICLNDPLKAIFGDALKRECMFTLLYLITIHIL